MAELDKKAKAKLSFLFLAGYEPREIALVLNIPANLIEKYYKEWKKWYDGLSEIEKRGLRHVYDL